MSLFTLYIISVVVSAVILIYGSAIEHKHINGYSELTLAGLLFSLFFAAIPLCNIIVVGMMAADFGNKFTIYKGKK